MLNVSEDFRRRMAQMTALPMFCLSFLFLVLVATLVVLWVDVPMFITPHEGDSLDRPVTATHAGVQTWISAQTALEAGYDCLLILYLLWPVFWAEFLVQYFYRNPAKPFWRRRYAGLIACLCPPLRMCTRHYDMDGKLWLPSFGWQNVNNDLRERLERLFSVPMIFIALTILPVLLVDVGMKHQVMAHSWLQILLHVSMGLIWFAFAAEFIVMVSVARRKFQYCKGHWLDIAIILLPIISFLRSLRIIRATRLARLAKVQQLSKMGRLYRLRGLVMRALRR